MVKIPGALATTDACTGIEAVPFSVTTAGTFPDVCPIPRISNGTCTLTNGLGPLGETLTIGAVMWLNATLTPLSEDGKDVPVKLAACVSSAEVKIVTSEPGATGSPTPPVAAKLAELTIPPLIM